MTPLGPLLFDGLPLWQVISRNTQIMWNQELISVGLGGGFRGIDYPGGLNKPWSLPFPPQHGGLGGRRIELVRHQFILLNFPKQLRAHVLEVGHVSTSHGIVEKGPSIILVQTFHLLQLGANPDLSETL